MNNNSFGGYGVRAASNKDYPKLSGFDATFRVAVKNNELDIVPEHIRLATIDDLRTLDESKRVLNYTATTADGRKVQARYYQVPATKEEGIKVEFIYPSIGGVLTGVSFVKNVKAKDRTELSIELNIGDKEAAINLPVDDTFAKDLMGRLSGDVNIGDIIKLVPYKIERDDIKGKFNRGIAVHKLVDNNIVKSENPFSMKGIRNAEYPKTTKPWDSMSDREKDNYGYDVVEFLQKEISNKFKATAYQTAVSSDAVDVDAEFEALAIGE
jgi:hypothetical protein